MAPVKSLNLWKNLVNKIIGKDKSKIKQIWLFPFLLWRYLVTQKQTPATLVNNFWMSSDQ